MRNCCAAVRSGSTDSVTTAPSGTPAGWWSSHLFPNSSAPHTEREHAANTILRELELQDSAAVWLAETGSFVPDAEIIRRAWDLDDLALRYRAFVGDFEARRPKTPDSQFAALVELVHAWRRFPFYDPEIPDTLLPPKWPGHTAKRLFDARHQTWARGAGEWFAEAEARGPSQ